MSDAAVILWPLAVFFTLGCAGAAWQSRNPVVELAALENLIGRHRQVKRWQQMPLWDEYRAQQDDALRFARSAARRAKLFAVLGLTASAAAVWAP